MLIDEYDNLANAVLARYGEAAYHALTHDDGFYRTFFAALKTGTDAGALERLFVTGVSPLAMDDVTSGFNIGRNLSLSPEFNAMLGFTEDEVREVLHTYHAAGAIGEDPEPRWPRCDVGTTATGSRREPRRMSTTRTWCSTSASAGGHLHRPSHRLPRLGTGRCEAVG